MGKLIKYLYLVFSGVLILYLALPNPDFPSQIPDSLQSNEPGDLEDPLRRSYFTNLTRDEVLEYYEKQFTQETILGFTLPTYRLNYPPEEAQTLIRDQTRSSYLEEIVHPLRESIFVNGFIPESEKDTILIKESVWFQKITVKFVPSNTILRISIGIGIIISIYLVVEAWNNFIETKKLWKR